MCSHKSWYSAKCIFQHATLSTSETEIVYEERIVLLRAESLDEALRLAEAEAQRYTAGNDEIRYCNFASVFHLFEDQIGDGAEVYSLMRQSPLSQSQYIDRYYDAGTERVQRT